MSTATLPTPIVRKTRKDDVFAGTVIDPVLFAENWLNVSLWSKQKTILHSIATKRKTAIKACHSSSKTFTAAIATLWWLARYTNAIVITTAPTQNQVENLLWAEVRRLVKQARYSYLSDGGKLTQVKLWMNDKRYALGFTTSIEHGDGGVKFQGFHAEHILLILDEAPGVDGVLWGAVEGLLASGDTRVLALGNPVISSGPFYDAFGANRTSWSLDSISAFDTPNLADVFLKFTKVDSEGVSKEVIYGNPDGKDLLRLTDEELTYNPTPYLTSRHWVKDRYVEWGPTHPLFISRVLGEFPSQSPDSLLSLEWLEKAKLKSITRTAKKLSAGLDVAGPGEDETSLWIRDGQSIVFSQSWPISDPRGEVVAALSPYKDKIEVNVDTVGIGYYLARHLEDLGFTVSDINVGERSSDPERYFNLKAELYWNLRMRFEAGDVAGLVDDLAIAQLASIRFKLNARGQIQIESKEEASKRGVKSPDRAEGVMLCFAPSFQHGLFGYWEELAKVNNQPKQVYTDANSLAETQKKEGGLTDMFNDSLHGVAAVKNLGKVMVPEEHKGCPHCNNPHLALYSGGAWRCNNCGMNGRNESNEIKHV